MVRRLALAAVCVSGLVMTAWLERGSVERANRLYRAGDPSAAAPLYDARTRADSTAMRVRYNLGTALLALGSEAAEPPLVRTTTAEELGLRGDALYNLGLWSLRRAAAARAADSVRAYASRSAELSKDVLRLLPGHGDAAWNLALAQRMLDSLDTREGRAGPEAADGAAASDQQILSEELLELEDVTDPALGPRRGADEAPADSEGGRPLTASEAASILLADRPPPAAIVTKLLTFEGRLRRTPTPGTRGPRW